MFLQLQIFVLHLVLQATNIFRQAIAITVIHHALDAQGQTSTSAHHAANRMS